MVPDPIPALKRQLGAELAPLVQGWRGADIAVSLRTEPARVSDLRRGELGRFSLETLIRFLTRLRYRVEVNVVSPAAQHRARIAARSEPQP